MAPEMINPKTTNLSQTAIPASLRRLSKIADNTGKLVDETKRIGPGDIVFKNLPRALAVRGEWQERKIAQVSKPAPQLISHPWSRLRCLRRWSLLLRPAPARWWRPYDRQWHQFLQLPVTGSLLPPDLAVKFMFICITLLRRIPANWRNWSAKWSGQKWNGAPVPRGSFTIKIEESWP